VGAQREGNLTLTQQYDNWFTDADELGTETGLGDRDSGEVGRALQLVAEFAKRRTASAWPHLVRAKVAAGLADRLRNPDLMDQYTTNLCGVVAVVRTWAYDSPAEYATLAIKLFELGHGVMVGHRRFGGRSIKPSADLKAAAPKSGMNHADWLVLSAIRESLNAIFDYSPTEGIFFIKAWSFPSDVEAEFRALGYNKIVNTANFASHRGYDNLMDASARYEKGWRVILLVNANLLSGVRGGVFTFSDHWIRAELAHRGFHRREASSLPVQYLHMGGNSAGDSATGLSRASALELLRIRRRALLNEGRLAAIGVKWGDSVGLPKLSRLL